MSDYIYSCIYLALIGDTLPLLYSKFEDRVIIYFALIAVPLMGLVLLRCQSAGETQQLLQLLTNLFAVAVLLSGCLLPDLDLILTSSRL